MISHLFLLFLQTLLENLAQLLAVSVWYLNFTKIKSRVMQLTKFYKDQIMSHVTYKKTLKFKFCQELLL